MKQEMRVWRQSLLILGLSDKEALLYELLLEQGELMGGEIERLSGQKKNTYTLLKRLEKKKLIFPIIKEGKRYYQPASPEKLFTLMAEQKRALLQSMSMLERVMPEMVESYRQRVGRPVVQYYSGLSGLRSVFDEAYKEGKDELVGFFGADTPDKKFFDEIATKYRPLRIKRNIFARSIAPDSPRSREFKKTEKSDLKELFLIDPIKYPMPAELDVWDDKIAMMSFGKGDFSALLIEHPDLAKAIHSLVKLAMDLLREKGEVEIERD